MSSLTNLTLKAALDGRLRNVGNDHLQPGRRADLRNAIAHGARADNAYDLDHRQNPSSKLRYRYLSSS